MIRAFAILAVFWGFWLLVAAWSAGDGIAALAPTPTVARWDEGRTPTPGVFTPPPGGEIGRRQRRWWSI